MSADVGPRVRLFDPRQYGVEPKAPKALPPTAIADWTWVVQRNMTDPPMAHPVTKRGDGCDAAAPRVFADRDRLASVRRERRRVLAYTKWWKPPRGDTRARRRLDNTASSRQKHDGEARNASPSPKRMEIQ